MARRLQAAASALQALAAPESPLSIRRLAIICNAIEEGRNGVGDYARRLARTLAAMGVAVDLLALNDPDVAEPVETALDADHQSIRLMRIPALLDDEERTRVAAVALQRWRPDWVSLQFVCYGLGRRGVILRALFWLPRLLKPYRRQVMVHETWIGHQQTHSGRDKLIGAVQRLSVLLFLRRLHPATIHTSNVLYQRQLAAGGLKAGLLPLFGNVPVGDATADWLTAAVEAACGLDISRARERVWIFGIFGSIYPSWRGEPLLERIAAFAGRADRRVVIVSIGRAGEQAPTILSAWQRRFPDTSFVLLGPRTGEEVSQFLNSIDYAITAYPIYLLGKSGTVAAMLEHGVPVIASGEDFTPELPLVWPPFSDLIWKDDDELERRLLLGRPSRPRVPVAEFVAKTLLEELGDAQVDGSASAAIGLDQKRDGALRRLNEKPSD